MPVNCQRELIEDSGGSSSHQTQNMYTGIRADMQFDINKKQKKQAGTNTSNVWKEQINK